MPDKRNGRWYTDIYIHGRRVRRSLGPKGTRKDAVALEAKLQQDALNSKVGRKPNRTFDDALLKWLKEDATQLKSYQNLLSKARQVRNYLSGTPLDQSHKAAASMRDALRAKGLKPATINRRLALVRRVLNVAYKRWDWLNEPIGSKIELLPENNARHIYLTKAQVLALSAECDDPSAGKAIILAACTGLRRAELLGLRAENLVDGCIWLGTNTKSGKPRIIPLPKWVGAVELPLGVTEHTLRKNFELARERIGMPELHFHDLRHTYASWLAASTGDLTAVRDLLGHSSLSVTSRYTHLLTDHLKNVVNKAFDE